MSGELEKLIIQAYTDADYSGEAIGEFHAYVNPNELTLAYGMEYDSGQGAGTTNSRMDFKQMKPGDLNVDLFLDGTGASGKKLDVQSAVSKFQEVTGYNGTIHRPNYLLVAWGNLTVRRCVLKSASIAYKVFKPSGAPLRAIISASFTDNSDDPTRVAETQDESSDLTHNRVFKAGDSLPMLCYQVYGDASLYAQIARINNLNSFRQIAPGTSLIFPPLER